jgi:hypothetical protein
MMYMASGEILREGGKGGIIDKTVGDILVTAKNDWSRYYTVIARYDG